jgi:hypothetical protein
MAEAKLNHTSLANTFGLNDLTQFVLQFSLFTLGLSGSSAARATLCFQ